jgi:hypothetical protein
VADYYAVAGRGKRLIEYLYPDLENDEKVKSAESLNIGRASSCKQNTASPHMQSDKTERNEAGE